MRFKSRFVVIMMIISIVSTYFIVDAMQQPIYKEKVVNDITRVPIIEVQYNEVEAQELYTLMRIVEAEATSGTVEQKSNVAHTILNRIESNMFPGTIKKVVFQKRQFSPISDGRYNKVNISDSTAKAVELALNGYKSHSSTFFMARKHSDIDNAVWFDRNLEFNFNDGMHEFFKEEK